MDRAIITDNLAGTERQVDILDLPPDDQFREPEPTPEQRLYTVENAIKVVAEILEAIV